jgi:hypothetical protein
MKRNNGQTSPVELLVKTRGQTVRQIDFKKRRFSTAVSAV